MGIRLTSAKARNVLGLGAWSTSALSIGALVGVAIASGAGCSSSSGTNGGPADGGPGGDDATACTGFGCNTNGDDSGIPTATCPAGTGFECTIATGCSGRPDNTTIHGTVYDPAGQQPLYNVSVYVPNAAPKKLTDGATCGSCSDLYTAPVVSAVTDAGGNFTITNAPDGDNIPLIVQVGKWRKQYKLSHVEKCATNDAAAIAGTKLRLPKNHTEGDIPNIAVSTGAADSLECLLHRIGVDSSEYTGDPAGAGRIKIFTGGDSSTPGRSGAVTNAPKSKQSYQWLWHDATSMGAYHLVLLSCEGNQTSYLDDHGRGVLSDYANGGGRVFASHFHYSWFTPTGPFSTVNPPLATWQTASTGYVGQPNDKNDADIVTTLPNGSPFPEGVAFKAWLGNVGALTNGKLPIYYARHNADVTATNTHSQSWVALDSSTPVPNATQYFSFDTPIGAAAPEQCGRVVFSDLHVSGGLGGNADPTVPSDYGSSLAIVPDGCAEHPLTAQEKALEFMIFELSACLTRVGDPTPTMIPK